MNSDNHAHHEHIHGESCGCGHDHTHDHTHHDHAHGEDCDCGHDHSQHHQASDFNLFDNGVLNETAAAFMNLLETHRFLPCARFVVTSSAEPEFSNVALAPVFINDGTEDILFLRAIGNVMTALEHQGYISIDYDIPLEGFDYSYFKESNAYKLFEETVAEGREREGFLGDTATIEFGSIAPLK